MVALVVIIIEPGEATTVYEVIGLVPGSPGALQVTVAGVLPLEATTLVGAPGTRCTPERSAPARSIGDPSGKSAERSGDADALSVTVALPRPLVTFAWPWPAPICALLANAVTSMFTRPLTDAGRLSPSFAGSENGIV